jgi:carbon-monoxide dehydrogenase medium subunit
MKPLISYHFPSVVKDAVACLRKMKQRAVIIGGGTRITRNLPAYAESVVDTRNLGLDYIEADEKGLRIGASVTFSRLMDSEIAGKWAHGILYDAACKVSSHLIRNMATVGGNLVKPYPYNNFPPVLTALDAELEIVTSQKTFLCPVSDIFKIKLVRILGRTALLKEIRIPANTKNWHASFEKFSPADSMWESIAIVCVALDMNRDICTDARISIGAAVPKAMRLLSVEKFLTGKHIDCQTAAEAASESMPPFEQITRTQASPEYKMEILPVLVERNILRAAGITEK